MWRLAALGWKTIARHRLRTSLVVTSLVLGILALTSVSASYSIMSRAITERAILQGGNAVTARVEISDVPNPLETARAWERRIQRLYSNAHVSLQLNGQGLSLVEGDKTLVGGDKTEGLKTHTQIMLTFVDANITNIRPFRVLRGTWLTGESYLAPRVVLNESAARLFNVGARKAGLSWSSLGEETNIRIQGVIHDGEPSPMAYLDIGTPGPWRDFALSAASPTLLIHAPRVGVDQLRKDLVQLASVADVKNTLGEISRIDTVETHESELGTTQLIFSLIAVVSLAIAALGILNIGLSTLAERADELSLQRVFGMRRYQILVMMLFESQIVAVLAGVLGVTLAWMWMPLVLRMMEVDYYNVAFPVDAAAIGVVAGLLTALCGAIVPAIQAMRLPISRIMRN